MNLIKTAVLFSAALVCTVALGQQPGGELRLSLRADPKTFDPLLVSEEGGQTVRYLTGGMLIRINRAAQKPEGEIAEKWQIVGRRLDFQIRKGVRFSDGREVTAADVVATIKRLLDPNLHAPTPDTFRAAFGTVTVQQTGPQTVSITGTKNVVDPEKYFDEIPIQPATEPRTATTGPFIVAEHKPGTTLTLKRNPHYWKRDKDGRPLPYLDAIRFAILQNRDMEFLRFQRGELHLIPALEAETYDRLLAKSKESAKDAGPSLDFEQVWFNQNPASPLASHKKTWFQNQAFRQAISMSINRQDLCKVVLRGRAQPAYGPASPANIRWYRADLNGNGFSRDKARQLLQTAGFRMNGAALSDAQGNPVEFTIITNAGNKTRERMATLIQEDLKTIGIKVNVLTLDFPSIVERLMKTFNYEACLLGMTNVEVDPTGQMNTFLSSSVMHAWNPGQKTPATPWEAEIDKLMATIGSDGVYANRKKAFDRVQQLIYEQAPIIYLVHKNVLAAVSPAVQNAAPTVLFPSLLWNAERLWISPGTLTSRR
ncbi:MAG: ABC transporter substrate-binding protein [Bryobacterales bacterium]|nr:ABC transporter substrate-binding protein [Bryobacterales bacterium]